MSEMKMSDSEKFKKWHSDRMGHPLGVILGINAVSELEVKVKRLKAEKECLIQAGYDANSSLRSDNDRMVEDIAELKAALMGLIEDVGAIYSPTGRCGCDEKHYTITSGEIDDIKLLLAKLNQEGEE